MLNECTEILAAMVDQLGLDRARAYEYVSENEGFEARAEIGGTGYEFASFENPFRLSTTGEDPISFLTYREKQIYIYERGEMKDYVDDQGQKASFKILFRCDAQVKSAQLNYLMDVPLVIDDRVVGKLTVDNKFKDMEHRDEGAELRRILEEKKDKIEYFADMAARAIDQARALTGRLSLSGRLRRVYKGWSDTKRAIIIAATTSVLTAATTVLLQWLLNGE